MRIIALGTLRDYWEHPAHRDAEQPLRAWYRDALRADWRTPDDIKATYRNASILKNNRVVFNIRGNTYRLIVAVHYDRGHVYVRFIGTHSEYDAIDAETV